MALNLIFMSSGTRAQSVVPTQDEVSFILIHHLAGRDQHIRAIRQNNVQEGIQAAKSLQDKLDAMPSELDTVFAITAKAAADFQELTLRARRQFQDLASSRKPTDALAQQINAERDAIVLAAFANIKAGLSPQAWAGLQRYRTAFQQDLRGTRVSAKP